MAGMNSTGSAIISWDFSHGRDRSVLLVSKEVNGRLDILNEFYDEEAEQLYEKLVPEHYCPLCGKRTIVSGHCESCN